MSPIKSTLAMLFALGSASVLAQNQATLTPTPSKPADSASYGPVLGPQPATASPAEPAPVGDARPQAQEERAGQPPTSKHNEVDPSARPAPQPVQPQQGEQSRKPKPPDKKGKQAVRRPVVQRIESTPRIAAQPPQPAPRVQVQAAPRPVGPSSSQVIGCVGSNCTDVGGASYNAGGPGNAAVSSSGQLCTRNGATMQCF